MSSFAFADALVYEDFLTSFSSLSSVSALGETFASYLDFVLSASFAISTVTLLSISAASSGSLLIRRFTLGGISAAFANPLPSLHPFDLCVGVAGAVAVRLIVYSKGKNTKKYRKGEEYGSARWGTAKDIAPYIDPKFENNILLTQTERLTMTGRPKDPKTARNKNVLVIGGSGSGKTRFYVKPNLMQCFPTSDYPTSFVVTDPKGSL